MDEKVGRDDYEVDHSNTLEEKDTGGPCRQRVGGKDRASHLSQQP